MSLRIMTILGVSLLLLPAAGCGEKGDQTSEPDTVAELPGMDDQAESRPSDAPIVQPDQQDPQAEQDAPAEADADLVALELELPPPAFMGTPKQVPPGTTVVIRQGPRQALHVPPGLENVALNRPVAASDDMPLIGELDQITDGEKDAGDGYFVDLGRGLQWVQIDLESQYEIFALAVWHLHSDARVYRDVIVQVADDPDFITDVQTIFNNDQDLTAGMGMGTDREYFETNEGLLIDAGGVTGRYVRLYSQGSTADDRNHYTEVEVFARPAE